uniref:Rubisco accumulation factor 1 C-terminal domain-containing protein n=1 Tax=Corethron hystrix TaxID=216773 RepID=A0A7S1B681_9STRA|mmetsp:Transcript_1463/g.3056  ORF Transcript_1463/g.3056 Transcript_1463/m.3056 type:complete len:186 (+) Transcript_1463:105-662(+)
MGLIITRHFLDQTFFVSLITMLEIHRKKKQLQVAGMYPGLTVSEFYGPSSDDAAETGQWTYDFSDPDGPQMGTVAFEGSPLVAATVDPVAVVCEHTSIGIPMPDILAEPVDVISLIDRSDKSFDERKFLVTSTGPDSEISIGAYTSKKDMPEGSEIVGRVIMVQIPWLPCMQKKKSGFMEDDALY